MALLGEDKVKNFWELREEPYFPFSQIDEITYPPAIEKAKNYRYELQKSKEFFESMSLSDINECREVLIEQIKLLKKKLYDGRSISRNQGLIIQNAVYAEIIGSVINSMKYRIPKEPTLYRTNDEKDRLDAQKLLSILEKYEVLLQKQHIERYESLIEIAERLIQEMQDLWKDENRTNVTV